MLHQHEDDAHPDTFFQMQKSMTVFGSGRKGLSKFIDSPQSFLIELLETDDHAMIDRHVRDSAQR